MGDTGVRAGAWWSRAGVVVLVVGAAALAVSSWIFGYVGHGLLDLQVYRMGGATVLAGDPLYDAVFHHDRLPFTYPPFAALLFVPFELAGFTGGAVLMTACTLAALARTAWLVAGAGWWRGPLARWSVGWRFALVGGLALLAWPTRSTIEYGQINVVLMWLIVEDLCGRGARARWGGALTGVAAALKVTPALFVVYTFLLGDLRRMVLAVGTAVAATAAGMVIGIDEWARYWTEELIDPTRVGDPHFLANQSLDGVLHRLGVDGSRSLPWLIGSVLAVAGGLVVGRTLYRRGDHVDGVLAVAIGGLVASPISWTHHWVWLVLAVPAIASWATTAVERRRWWPAGLAAAAVVALGVRLETVLPSKDGVELTYGPLQQVVASSYLLIGVAVLAGLAITALRPEATSADEEVPAPVAA